MPYRRSYKRKPYKRRYAKGRKYSRKYRKRRRYNNTLSSSRPLKTKQIFRTRYVDRGIILNPGAGGVPSSYIFSANGLYDPNVTGIGHQPIGFDQMMPMYDHYVVVGAKATVTFANDSSIDSQLVGIMLKDNAVPESDGRLMLENGHVKYVHLSTREAGGSAKTVTFNVNPNKFLGHSKPLSEADLKGDDGHNPTEQAYLHVFAMPSNDTVDPSTVTCTVVIDYTAILIEPKKLSIS